MVHVVCIDLAVALNYFFKRPQGFTISDQLWENQYFRYSIHKATPSLHMVIIIQQEVHLVVFLHSKFCWLPVQNGIIAKVAN